MNRGRTRPPATTFSLPSFIIITTTTIIITITDTGTVMAPDMDMDPGMDMDPVWWSRLDTGVTIITITIITTIASIPAIEGVSHGMTIKQDPGVLFFCVAQGCSIVFS